MIELARTPISPATSLNQQNGDRLYSDYRRFDFKNSASRIRIYLGESRKHIVYVTLHRRQFSLKILLKAHRATLFRLRLKIVEISFQPDCLGIFQFVPIVRLSS